MINLINKNRDQPMSLGDRDSYYEDFATNNLPKGEKGKTGYTHSDDLPALFKDNNNNGKCAENNNNGAVVGQKRPITNNDGGNNTPAKVPCYQNPAKTVSYDLCEAGNLPTALLLGDDLPKKIREVKESPNLPHIPYLNCHDTQDIKTREGAAKQRTIFCPRVTNTEYDIAHTTKTIDNTGINKYSKYKALRHTIYQGILQIPE